MDRHWTEADIAALIDGALHGAEEQRIARILESDPEAQACADRLRETNALLREAFAAPMTEPLPPSMQALFDESETVVPFRAARQPVVRHWALPTALAASIALLVGFASGSFLTPWPTVPGGTPSMLAVGPAGVTVSRVLETTISGTTLDGVKPVASFRVTSGGICREFETTGHTPGADRAFGIACTDGGAWQVIMAASIATADQAAATGFAPASGAAVDAAVPVLDALGAGAAMTAAEEQQALENAWR